MKSRNSPDAQTMSYRETVRALNADIEAAWQAHMREHKERYVKGLQEAGKTPKQIEQFFISSKQSFQLKTIERFKRLLKEDESDVEETSNDKLTPAF